VLPTQIPEDPNGKEYDVDSDLGGGVTGKRERGNREIVISGNDQPDAKSTEGEPLRNDAADVLAHEFVGHAIPQIVGSDTGNAVENENKVRRQLKDGENQLRQAEPNHVEESGT